MAVSTQRPRVAVICLLLYFLSGALSHPDPRQREALIQLEASMQLGGQIVLTDAEQRLDSVLMKNKWEELRRADFPPAMHFFKARSLIRTSPIFSVLQKMPKGGFNPNIKHSHQGITDSYHRLLYKIKNSYAIIYIPSPEIPNFYNIMGCCILRTTFASYTT